jgi:hypothetical protein
VSSKQNFEESKKKKGKEKKMKKRKYLPCRLYGVRLHSLPELLGEQQQVAGAKSYWLTSYAGTKRNSHQLHLHAVPVCKANHHLFEPVKQKAPHSSQFCLPQLREKQSLIKSGN